MKDRLGCPQPLRTNLTPSCCNEKKGVVIHWGPISTLSGRSEEGERLLGLADAVGCLSPVEAAQTL